MAGHLRGPVKCLRSAGGKFAYGIDANTFETKTAMPGRENISDVPVVEGGGGGYQVGLIFRHVISRYVLRTHVGTGHHAVGCGTVSMRITSSITNSITNSSILT